MVRAERRGPVPLKPARGAPIQDHMEKTRSTANRRRTRGARPGLVAGAALAVAAGSLALADTASARMNIIYASDPAAKTIIKPDRPAGLGFEDNVFRQEPSGSGLFAPPGGKQFRIAKLGGNQLAKMTAVEMVSALRTKIDEGCGAFGCASGLVAVDELTPAFSDGRVKIRRKTVNVRGRSIRIVAYNDIKVTRNGYRVIRRDPPIADVERDSPGSRLTRAMRALEQVESPYGGTYASRVHFYLSPAFVTSVGLGKGPHRTLGADGLPHRRSWRGVMPALIQAGGVWLEMYNGSNVYRPSSAYPVGHWLKIPKSFTSYFRSFGGQRQRLHFLIADSEKVPEGAPEGCGGGDPMDCQWQLADLPGVNRAILRNGVGAYSVGTQADEWLANYAVRVRGKPVVFQD